MKKGFLKKLSLNKKTITRLQNEEMSIVKGGTTVTLETCYCDTASCSIHINCCNIKKKEIYTNLELDSK